MTVSLIRKLYNTASSVTFMGISDWFKKEPKLIEVSLDLLENWIEEKKIETRDEEGIFVNSVKKRIKNLLDELEYEIEVLERVDLSEKKEVERARHIIEENLNNYINYVKKLKENLETVEITIWMSSDMLVKKIHAVFLEFEKRSMKSFQKATILVGKEIEAVKNSIAEFFKDFNRKIKENKKLMENSHVIFFVDDKLKELGKIKDVKEEIMNKIQTIDSNIKKFNKMVNQIHAEIEAVKKSQEYLDEIAEEEKIKNQKAEVEKKIYELKQAIDFKELTRIFHSNKKEMEMIKKFREDFQTVFEDVSVFMEFLKISNLLTEIVSFDINRIIEMKKEIADSEDKLELKISSEIVVKNSEAERLKREIGELEKEKTKEIGRTEKLEENKEDIINLIKEKLKEINVILV